MQQASQSVDPDGGTLTVPTAQHLVQTVESFHRLGIGASFKEHAFELVQAENRLRLLQIHRQLLAALGQLFQLTRLDHLVQLIETASHLRFLQSVHQILEVLQPFQRVGSFGHGLEELGHRLGVFALHTAHVVHQPGHSLETLIGVR